MGDKQSRPFQHSFNGLLKIDFQGSRVTSMAAKRFQIEGVLYQPEAANDDDW